MNDDAQHKWWQTGIIYEIYLRSFQDSNNDGIGDLRGIINRLDYLQWLGVNILWITPFYPSPMKDFGYDISDYTAVDSRFGDMQDFDDLVAEVHRRNMKLVIDFVPNHTSDQHPWFKESKSSRFNLKRDWYIWQSPAHGKSPNNWLSVLGGSAWQWDEVTQQYYYHAFLKEQPDLDLTNAEVMNAISDVMRFWLSKGVDGFRVDVMWHLAKDKLLRDNPVNPNYKPSMPDCDRLQQIYSCDRPEVHEVIAQLRKVLDEYDDRVMMGEIYLSPDKTIPYYGEKNNEAHLPSNFQLLFIPWKAKDISGAIEEYEALLPKDAWPNWAIGNHDRARLISRISKDQTRNAAILLLTLRGTPVLYYGDEIGIPQVQIPKEEVQDPQGLLMPDKGLSRDPQRTPMQWDKSLNAGFTRAKPWLRLSNDYPEQNVEVQSKDDESLLSFYKRMIALRQSEPSLMYGSYSEVFSDENIFAYTRQSALGDTFLIVLNFTDEKHLFSPDQRLEGSIEIATDAKWEGRIFRNELDIEPNMGLVIRLDK